MGSRAESCRLDCGRGTDLRRGLEFVNHVPMGAESQARAVAEAARDVDDAGRSVRRAGKPEFRSWWAFIPDFWRELPINTGVCVRESRKSVGTCLS